VIGKGGEEKSNYSWKGGGGGGAHLQFSGHHTIRGSNASNTRRNQGARARIPGWVTWKKEGGGFSGPGGWERAYNNRLRGKKDLDRNGESPSKNGRGGFPQRWCFPIIEKTRRRRQRPGIWKPRSRGEKTCKPWRRIRGMPKKLLDAKELVRFEI